MQQIQDDIRKAQEKVNQETLVYQQKVLDQTEDPDPVDLVLKALGVTGGLADAQLTEEQKRRLEAIKEEEAKRRRVQVETPPAWVLRQEMCKASHRAWEEASLGAGVAMAVTRAADRLKSRSPRGAPHKLAPLKSPCGSLFMGSKRGALSLQHNFVCVRCALFKPGTDASLGSTPRLRD